VSLFEVRSDLEKKCDIFINFGCAYKYEHIFLPGLVLKHGVEKGQLAVEIHFPALSLAAWAVHSFQGLC